MMEGGRNLVDNVTEDRLELVLMDRPDTANHYCLLFAGSQAHELPLIAVQAVLSPILVQGYSCNWGMEDELKIYQ